jgi:RNA recognition motif-containing protein
VREHPGWWAVTKTIFRLPNLPEIIGQFFSNCPIFFKHEDIFRMPKKIAHKSKLSDIYKAPVIIEQNKNSQNANIFQAPRFFRVPNFLGRNGKKINIYNFPSRLTFPKLPEIFPSIFNK